MVNYNNPKEDLSNFKTAQGLEESFTGVYTYIEEAAQASARLDGTVADSNEALGRLQEIAADGIRLGDSPNQLLFSGDTGNKAELDYLDALTSSAREFWKSLDGSRRSELDVIGINDATLFQHPMRMTAPLNCIHRHIASPLRKKPRWKPSLKITFPVPAAHC